MASGGATRPTVGDHFWLDTLNQFAGNDERAEMIKAFTVSGEQ